MANATSSDNNHIPEIGPSSGHVPNKLAGDTFTFQSHQWLEPVDVTDGNWHDLTIWRTMHAGGTANELATYNVGNIGMIKMQDIIGIPRTDKMTSTAAPTSYVTGDSTMYYNYAYGALNSISVHLKNFLVTVERDSSGGIQWKDEPVFEVQVYPIDNILGRYVSNAVAWNPANVYTSTLKEGIKLGNSLNMSLTPRDQYFGYKNTATTGIVYASYMTFGEFLREEFFPPSSGDIAVAWGDKIPWYAHLHNPIYAVSVRIINIPRGLSNIKVTLSYSSELTSNWTLKARNINPPSDYIDIHFPFEGQTRTFTTRTARSLHFPIQLETASSTETPEQKKRKLEASLK